MDAQRTTDIPRCVSPRRAARKCSSRFPTLEPSERKTFILRLWDTNENSDHENTACRRADRQYRSFPGRAGFLSGVVEQTRFKSRRRDGRLRTGFSFALDVRSITRVALPGYARPFSQIGPMHG